MKPILGKETICALLIATLQFSIAQPVSAQSADASENARTVQLSDLSGPQKRKLTFYAHQVFEHLADAAAFERSEKQTELEKSLSEASRAAERLTKAAEGLNVPPDQVSTLVWQQFATGYAGPLPQMVIDGNGSLDITTFLYGERSNEANVASGGDYVDLLRAENAGSITN